MAHPIDESGCIRLTAHAERRLAERGIRLDDVALAILYGRRAWIRGAQIFVLGRQELEGLGLAATWRLDGLQVVCSPEGVVVTVYRNRNLRGLRPRSRRPHFCNAA